MAHLDPDVGAFLVSAIPKTGHEGADRGTCCPDDHFRPRADIRLREEFFWPQPVDLLMGAP